MSKIIETYFDGMYYRHRFDCGHLALWKTKKAKISPDKERICKVCECKSLRNGRSVRFHSGELDKRS